LEPTVYENPSNETLETVLKDLDNQEELTGTLVLVKDVKKQENGPVERFLVELTQLQNLKDKPKVSYCIPFLHIVLIIIANCSTLLKHTKKLKFLGIWYRFNFLI